MGQHKIEIVQQLHLVADMIERLADQIYEPEGIVAGQPENSPPWRTLSFGAREQKCLIACCQIQGRRLATVHDVAALDEMALLETRQCGAKTLSAIKEALAKHGLTLGYKATAKGGSRAIYKK